MSDIDAKGNGAGDEGDRTLTNRQGHPVVDNQSQRTVGARGPATLELVDGLDRRNDYVQPRARYCTMLDWERDELVKTMGGMLAESERDVQERMIWHLLLIHDDYGTRCGEMIGLNAGDVRHLQPLPGQVLTDEDRARLERLGSNGNVIDPEAWGKWTSSVPNRAASAEEVLGGMREEPVATG